MNFLNKVRLNLESLNAWSWILLNSVLAFAAVAGAQIVLAKIGETGSWRARIFLCALLLAGAVVYFWIFHVSARIRDRVFPKYGHLVLAMQRELDTALADENRVLTEAPSVRSLKERHIEVMSDYMRATHRAVSQHWSEERFGSATQTDVVLMTRSLGDGEMTCASWAVRRPFSLTAREDDSTVYNDTEAARMYQSAETGRVGTRVIPDTGVPQRNYTFLNNTEKERIRSTALHPVYDPESELIGIIVAHTNRPNVFKDEDLDFWTAFFRLIEPHVARRIILARAHTWGGDSPW
jgi:GAF domain-containing protein